MTDIPQYKSTLTGTEIDAAMKKMAENEIGDFVVEKQLADYVLKSALLDLVYPVGSVYISYNSASPAALFGGSWTQIQGRFLLAADSAHSAGSTGGEETVSLTANQNGPHYHKGLAVDGTSIKWTWPAVSPGSGNNGTLTTSGSTVPVSGSSGSGAPHNNMPPYMVVYMWWRTA